jgi:hypothetical protein
MQKLIVLILELFLSLNVFSQPVVRIARYSIALPGEAETQLVFTMPFGKADIIKITGDTSQLKNAGDLVVDVVCTEYPSNLSLTELNRQRLLHFLALFPYLSKTQIVSVNIYRQMEGSEKQTADTMFHGLVVRYRPKQNAETMHRDVARLEEMLLPAPGYGSMPTTRIAAHPPTSSKDSVAKNPAPEKSYNQFRSLHARKPSSEWFQMTITPDATTESSNKKISFGGINTFIAKSSLQVDSPVSITPRGALLKKIISPAQYNAFKSCKKIVIVVTKPPPTEPPVPAAEKEIFRETSGVASDSGIAKKTRFVPRYPLADSTLFKILTRNQWHNAVIVGDVTGSMYPYNGQLLLWLRMHTVDSLGTEFVFFNDGDGLPDDKKTLGNTGGIYSAECNTFDEVLALVKSTMIKGSGGDNPENDIEALLEAESSFPDAENTVLIADNWAPMRDMALANKLTRPVKIVLFGTGRSAVNADFLNLARKTKGTVHLIDEDITNLAAMHEGEVLKIGTYRYKILKGEFVEMDKL